MYDLNPQMNIWSIPTLNRKMIVKIKKNQQTI